MLAIHFRLPLGALLLGLALALPQVATAADPCEAPPGTSGLDQYCESLPGPDRDHGAGSERPKDTRAVPPKVEQQLQGQGGDGRAVIELAASDPAGRSAESDAQKRRRANGEAAPEPSNNPLSVVNSSVAGGSTAGPALAWLLIGVGLLLSAVAWVRFRRRDGSERS